MAHAGKAVARRERESRAVSSRGVRFTAAACADAAGGVQWRGRMHLRRFALQHFRNIAWAELALPAAGAAFVGANAQGKTNLLEAVGLLTALRSFRQSDNRLLIAHDQPEAALRFELEHERFGATVVTVRLRPEGKEVQIDATPVARFGEFLGRFPTVLFSSQDNQLVRGSPAGRRRWLDLVLAAMDGAYLEVLQRYHRALDGRNRLLKERADAAQLAAFEHPLAAAGAAVMQARAAGVAELGARLRAAYGAMANGVMPQSGIASTSTRRGSLPAKAMARCSSAANCTRNSSSGRPRYWLLTPMSRLTSTCSPAMGDCACAASMPASSSSVVQPVVATIRGSPRSRPSRRKARASCTGQRPPASTPSPML